MRCLLFNIEPYALISSEKFKFNFLSGAMGDNFETPLMRNFLLMAASAFLSTHTITNIVFDGLEGDIA